MNSKKLVLKGFFFHTRSVSSELIAHSLQGLFNRRSQGTAECPHALRLSMMHLSVSTQRPKNIRLQKILHQRYIANLITFSLAVENDYSVKKRLKLIWNMAKTLQTGKLKPFI